MASSVSLLQDLMSRLVKLKRWCAFQADNDLNTALMLEFMF